MLNSRDVNLLRPDVAANCRVFLSLCKAEGLNVLVVNTVRDDAYQLQCYKNGTGGKPPATFHSVKAGLAFDICKNVKGHAYDDPAFFRRCGAIGQRVGFEWGGGWSHFVDRPHFQWSDHGKFTGSDIRRGVYPPVMPLYKEEVEDMTREDVLALVRDELAERDAVVAAQAQKVSPWAQEAWDKLCAAGVFDGTRPGGNVTREQLAAVIARLEAGK